MKRLRWYANQARKKEFVLYHVPLYVDEDIMAATLHDRCVSKELKNQWLLLKMISQSIQRESESFAEKPEKLRNWHCKSHKRLLLPRVIIRSSVALNKDCMSNPLKKLLDRSKIQEQVRSDRTKVFVEKYQSCDSEHQLESIQKMMEPVLLIGFLIERYHAEKLIKIQFFCNTKTTAHYLGEYYAPGQGSATDGSSQANDIDGKKKAKRAEVPTNTCQFPPIKSMDVSQH
ncbi:hypothetical protein Bca52824_087366 [Brassica carinata]|uniref:Uncharacterized protein n=1 Tax=Brassica carinata TaxID=52824 RepID=A0A8X7PBI7_BRACI|nr:hypothetical protein Bca52824_087366 [Brassica carinata]